MDDLDVLARDFGFRPQGKSAPMRSTSSSSSPFHPSGTSATDFDYDSIFKSSGSNSVNTSKTTDGPVYDKPVYDDDIFDGLPGIKSKSVSSSSTGMKFEDDVFGSKRGGDDHFDDLLGNVGSSRATGMDDFLGSLGRNEKVAAENKSSGRSSSSRDFDDLLGGFGSDSPAIGNRPTNVSPHHVKQTSDDPFVVLDSTSPPSSSARMYLDPLKDVNNFGKSGNSKIDTSSVSGQAFDDINPLNGFNKSVPPFSPEKDGSPLKSRPGFSSEHASVGRKHRDASSFRHSESNYQKKEPVDNLQESPLFDIPGVSIDPKKSFGQNVSPPPYKEKNFQADVSPRSEELPKSSDEIWLSVSEVPLFTKPTKAPPPSRPPPAIPGRTSKAGSDYFSSSTRKRSEDYSAGYSSYSDSPKPRHPEGNNSSVSQIDDLEDFAMGRSHDNIQNDSNIHPGEDMDAAAAAMKEAMDRAEAKFRHAKEVREREYAKAAKSKETFQAEMDEETAQEVRQRDYRENQERLELERRQKEKEEQEREQRRLEKERTDRERARQAVERATREARDRAAAEARLRAERAAVAKAQAEARERAGKAAVQRVQAEARERAATEARERAEKAAAEAKEREAKERAEAQRRSQRAAADRAAAEARERAAANAARASQQKSENDLESFFSSRPSSVPKARTSSADPFFDQFQSKGGSDAAKRTSSTSGPTSNIKKASSATNFDDLSSIFGASSSSGNFQEVEGETEERRRARLERHQRTQERANKALAEKNQRDMQVLRDQEERNRIAETLDLEIKRWAAGKEGNLRALLSTMQYVLWPECGWQPVSLTDLITGASVKKAYRKATLCIHPDKVQQKGATLQQKYIAEKVFDLLKEAWNKFNSEELF